MLISLARMAEDLFVRPDGKPMTFLMGSSQEKKQVQIVSCPLSGVNSFEMNISAPPKVIFHHGGPAPMTGGT